MTTYNLETTVFCVVSILLLFALIIFVRGFKKYRPIPKKGTQFFLYTFGLLMLAPMILVDLYAWFLFLLVFPSYPHNSFNKADWATNVPQRYTMADDLVESKTLIGLTRNQVIDLLGNPYREWDKIDHTIRYPIGDKPAVGLDLDPDELVLDLEAGKVINCYLHET